MPSERSPEEIADEIVNVASEAAYGDCPKRHMDATDEHCPGCLRSMIAAAIREAEVRGAKVERERMIAAIRDEARSTPMDKRVEISEALVRKCDMMWHAYDVICDINPAAISAERSAGTSPNDRLVTPKLAVAARSAPAPVRPPAVRVPTPEEIAAMPLEQVAAETARLKRETGAVGGISRCEPAPACARCGGSGEIVAHASAVRNPGGGIERIVRRFEPCPECRGTP